MTLGNRISLLRKEQKLSQEALAEAMQVSRQAVSKWENDLSSPDTENLIALARLLGTDVEFLATGQLTDEMESEALPESEPVPSAPKRKRKWGWVLPVLLILSLLGNLILGVLWQMEKQDRSEMELLCTSAAYAARESFADYAHYGNDAQYWDGVAEFRRFMQGYLFLCDGVSNANYLWCNELYGNLLYWKENVEPYLEELRRAMRLLYEDIYDETAYQAIFELNNLIQYGP